MGRFPKDSRLLKVFILCVLWQNGYSQERTKPWSASAKVVRPISATALIPERLGQAGDSLPGTGARRPKLSRQKGVLLSTSHSKTSIEWLQHAVVGLPGCEQPGRLASAAKYRVRLHCESSSAMLQPSIPAHSLGKQPKWTRSQGPAKRINKPDKILATKRRPL